MIGFGVSAAGLAVDTFNSWQNAGHIVAGLLLLAFVLGLRRRPKALKWVAVLAGVAALFFGTLGVLEGVTRNGRSSALPFLDSWAPSHFWEPLADAVLIGLALWALSSAFLGTRAPAGADSGAASPGRPPGAH